uniref:Carboxylic ester hydrolase n=1 Tax=Acrobeloides nanus TaxID=290746 RepID=A0A914E144_9BILA
MIESNEVSVDDSNLQVQTNYGTVEGFSHITPGGVKADIFLGIPYAEPPVDDLRLEKPIPPKKWDSVKETKDFTQACVPHNLLFGFLVDYNEDCLYMNIYKPSKKSSNPKGYPVLFWIHGGGFEMGDMPSYGFENITDLFIPRGVIVVAIQYRLGQLGFMSTGDNVMPGNLGLWDQTLALKFVKENIAYFGGNPDKITVWGQSAGAASVDMLSLSPHSRNLFSQAIQNSGSSLTEWAFSDRVVGVTKKLAADLGCPTNSSIAIKNCLKKANLDDMHEKEDLRTITRNDFNFAWYQPRMDGDFFPKSLDELVVEAPKKPLMIGFMKIESQCFAIDGDRPIPSFELEYAVSEDKVSSYNRTDFINFIRDYATPQEIFENDTKSARKDILNFYLSNFTKKATGYNTFLSKFVQLVSDVQFNIPVIWNSILKRNADWPVYLYRFDHITDFMAKQVQLKAPMHGADLPYFFGKFLFAVLEPDQNDLKLQNSYINAIANFVKTGNPSTRRNNWPSLQKGQPLGFMRIAPKMKYVERLPYYEKAANFWSNFAKKYRFDLIRGIYRDTKKPKAQL